jgi:hypothetical protein
MKATAKSMCQAPRQKWPDARLNASQKEIQPVQAAESFGRGRFDIRFWFHARPCRRILTLKSAL